MKKSPLQFFSISVLIFVTILAPRIAIAQEITPPAEVSDEELKRANDPIANVKAFNIHNYFIPSMFGLKHSSMNQLIFRYAQPAGDFLFRASMPVLMSAPANELPVTGTGDFNVSAIYTFPTSTENKFGVGPSVTFPTGTNDLGAGKWQGGISGLAYLAKNSVIQGGSFLQWQGSFAGDNDKADISLLTAQMFAFWQMGKAFYLRSSGIWSFNLKNGDYNVPFGLGIGKVIKTGKVVFNLFAEPQITVLGDGIGQPKFQTYIGFNTQF